jgi:dihydrofolate synthase/folylpolyglutamate synthase
MQVSKSTGHSGIVFRVPKQIHNVREAQEYLYGGMPTSSGAAFKGPGGLARAHHFFSLLDNPQNAFKSVHIAGTSGKGSIAYILTNLLMAHGLVVGTHTSPHFYDIRERFLINGGLLPERIFVDIVNGLMPQIELMGHSEYGGASFFETSNAIAFQAFADAHVDYAVIETGLGGLLDSTNSIARSDKVSIIGKLGFDHTEILGHTLKEIAYQKAGIINPDSFAIALEPSDADAKAMITGVAEERHAELKFINPRVTVTGARTTVNGSIFDYYGEALQLQGVRLGAYGQHQIENTALALQALEYLSRRDGFTLNPSEILATLSKLKIPGRFETRSWEGRELILDGAHNPQKIAALADALDTYTNKKNITAVVAFKQDKDIEEIARILSAHVDKVVISAYHINPDDTLHAAATPDYIQKCFEKVGIKSFVSRGSARQALHEATRNSHAGAPILVTGSIYFVGEVGAYLNSLGAEIPPRSLQLAGE